MSSTPEVDAQVVPSPTPSSSAPSVKGKPVRLDVVWRPVWFVLLGVAGLLASAWLAWRGMWVVMPLPFAGALLLHQVIFWLRGDRPLVATLDGSRLVCVDQKGGSNLDVDLSQATAASLSIREGDEDQAFLVLHDDRRELVALRLKTPHRSWPEDAVVLDALQPVLGGNAGILRGLAGSAKIVRQTLQDKDGAFTSAVLAAVPPSAWSRVSVRVWRGADPAVDYMGLHQDMPDALLTVGEEGWTLTDRMTGEQTRGTLDASQGWRARKHLALLPVPGVDSERVTALPLLVWQLAEGLRLVIPAPIAGHQGELVELDDNALHTHLAEGSQLAWWLLDRLPAGQIPEGLKQAIADSRVAKQHPHTVLRRHL